MNRKDGENPENLEGLGDMLPADALKLLNELLEHLHQSDHTNHGSKIELVYVASGGQHVETQIIIGETRSKSEPESGPPSAGQGRSAGKLPDVLSTEQAMALWEKVQKAGYVDDNYQPLLSRTQSALLADTLAERLGIKNKWKVFETLWNRTKMYKDCYEAVEQRQYLPFLDKLKQVLD